MYCFLLINSMYVLLFSTGSQLKSMHNLRLMAATPWQLVEQQLSEPERTARLHRSLGLYSRQLSGLILLVDSRPKVLTGVKQGDFSSTIHVMLMKNRRSGGRLPLKDDGQICKYAYD